MQTLEVFTQYIFNLRESHMVSCTRFEFILKIPSKVINYIRLVFALTII